MELKKIKLHGFKSFDKPTELDIYPGLTGIVGPNGCGKSNILDSLQWVMGETSYKNLRGSEMDDVIFSGTDTSASRNFAEVSVVLAEHKLSHKNDSDNEYEIRRRIERNSGSKYFINSIEKRAKDVQLFFADNSLGPHSVSIVKQGNINQLIEAKPSERRKILEEAAGISGLHHRKHEAILRLNATKANIERINDIIKEINTQLSSLKRQYNQAEKFKIIAARIRQFEKELLQIEWNALTDRESELKNQISTKENTIQLQKNKINDLQIKVGNLKKQIQPIRDNYNSTSEEIQKKNSALLNIKNEIQYTSERINNTRSQISIIKQDIQREIKNSADHKEQLQKLAIKKQELQRNLNEINKIEHEVIESSLGATQNYKSLEEEYNNFLSKLVEKKTEKTTIENQINDIEKSILHHSAQLDGLVQEEKKIKLENNLEKNRQSLNEKQILLENNVKTLLSDISEKEALKEKLLQDIQNNKNQIIEQEFKIKQLTISRENIETYLKENDTSGSIIESIEIEDTYKVLVSSILEDLENSTLDEDTKYWLNKKAIHLNKFDKSIKPLSDIVRGPKEIALFLQFSGFTEEKDIKKILELLEPGQQVINSDGKIIRWDGLIKKININDETSNILAAKINFKKNLDQAEIIDIEIKKLETQQNQIESKYKLTIEEEKKLKESWSAKINEQQKNINSLQMINEEIVLAQDIATQIKTKINTENDTLKSLNGRIQSLRSQTIKQDNIDVLEKNLGKVRQEFYNAKTIADMKEANTQNLLKEKRELEKNLEDIVASEDSWENRKIQSDIHLKELNSRIENLDIQLNKLQHVPSQLENEQKEIDLSIQDLSRKRLTFKEELLVKENEFEANSADIKIQENNLSRESEILVHARAQIENLEEKKIDLKDKIKINLEIEIDNLLDDFNPELDKETIINALAAVHRQREQIGAVNLTAEDEYIEVKNRYDQLIIERDDLLSATENLQKGIVEIDKEARARLLNSYENVNNNFKLLFEKLFDGGKAELRLNTEEDILESGLDIIAWPPGKKPQTISLLSGGEQALTVIALIIAVFLENPSPICILDEVDAPLDDNNVKKFCDLLDELSKSTKTKFLIVTHHPYTMSRMDRLYGVTMAKRGESVILSVDLNQAENIVKENYVA